MKDRLGVFCLKAIVGKQDSTCCMHALHAQLALCQPRARPPNLVKNLEKSQVLILYSKQSQPSSWQPELRSSASLQAIAPTFLSRFSSASPAHHLAASRPADIPRHTAAHQPVLGRHAPLPVSPSTFPVRHSPPSRPLISPLPFPPTRGARSGRSSGTRPRLSRRLRRGSCIGVSRTIMSVVTLCHHSTLTIGGIEPGDASVEVGRPVFLIAWSESNLSCTATY